MADTFFFLRIYHNDELVFQGMFKVNNKQKEFKIVEYLVSIKPL